MNEHEGQAQITPGTISHLQDYIAAKIRERGFADETLHECLLMLTEEVGELVKACRKQMGMYVDPNQADLTRVGEEVVDVINMIFAVGVNLGLDIEKEFVAKERQIDQRTYARTPIPPKSPEA